ncbi:hypothetical protein DFA_10334 [Cavenderia fasciculata]|uniref:Uncharacterized protein n=1 Tax=Cavenderia fasciculata TaxID=261658 RepID=F4Q9X5_CACFS|nr:uncharacterized protein DFA_10334 [Cavenderia fasciculata]EGG15494.1 hypothetical protein DFA_10334 [Cavenderia fasciculata]|eukprot:XP_004354236.1 hypothetical protein DFA_10334 [Cavenderia fasciculata]
MKDRDKFIHTKNSFQKILNNQVIRKIIFNHVSSIHKQLEIQPIKFSTLFTLVDYIRYGLNDLFFKHIDQLWTMMFTDGIYRNDHSHRLTRILSAAISFNNYRVLEYLLNRIKREISPFQMTISIDFIDTCHGKDNIYCLNPKVFNLLVDDSIFIESNRLLNRMVKTAILVFGDVDIIRELFGLYNLSNLIDLFRQYEPIDCGLPTMIKDLFNKKTDTELIQLYNVVTKLNKMVDKDTQGNIKVYSLVYDRLNFIKHVSQGNAIIKPEWKPNILSPHLFSPYASKRIQENERKKEIKEIYHTEDFIYYYDDQGLMDKIKDGTDIEYIRHIFSPQTTINNSDDIFMMMQTPDYFAGSLASGSDQSVTFLLEYVRQQSDPGFKFRIGTSRLMFSIHPVFCSRHYIDLLGRYVRPTDYSCSNIIRSTLQHAQKGQEYDQLDYLLKSALCRSINIDFSDSIASIIDMTNGNVYHDLIERLVAYVKVKPNHCIFPFESVHKYTRDDYQGRDQFISVVGRILNEWDNTSKPSFRIRIRNEWTLHPALIERLTYLFCKSHPPFGEYEEIYYLFLKSAAITANMDLFKRIFFAISAISTIPTFDLVRILLLVVNASHYQFAMKYVNEFIDVTLIAQMLSPYLKSSIEILFNLYFYLAKKDIESKQEDIDIDQFQDYQQLANQILDLVPTRNKFEIIYYATELTDDQFNILWVRFSDDLNIRDWLVHPSNHHTDFKYDQKFFNHLERLYRLYQQDQLDKYQYIKYPMNPPPLTRRYIGIWNQCLQNYYFNKNNNNNNRIVKNYTQKKYDKFMSLAIEIGFTPSGVDENKK